MDPQGRIPHLIDGIVISVLSQRNSVRAPDQQEPPDATFSVVFIVGVPQSEFVHLTNDISSDLFIGYGSVELHALYLGPAAQARSVLAASYLLPTVGQPLQENYDQMSYIDAVVEFGNQAEVRTSAVGHSSRSLHWPCRFTHRALFLSDVNIKPPVPAAMPGAIGTGHPVSPMPQHNADGALCRCTGAAAAAA